MGEGEQGRLPTGRVTFLMTDIEGSTPLWELDPVGMAAALEHHDRLVAAAVSGAGGVLLKAKGEGDSTMSVFPSAAPAAAAAVAVQRRIDEVVAPGSGALRVRIALHTGDAVERDGDYFGPTVNRAARLRGTAGGGDIVVSQACTEAIRSDLPAGMALVELGERELKGLRQGERVWSLTTAARAVPGVDATALWPAQTAGYTRPPLPASLDSPPGELQVVGRPETRAALWQAFLTAERGGTASLVLHGAAGTGKSRLAAELARRAHARGATILFGRCDEHAPDPDQPFAESIRRIVAHVPVGWLARQEVHHLQELVHLAPALRSRLPNAARPTADDGPGDRRPLFDAVLELLARVGQDDPVVLVIDDLQNASPGTIELLHWITREGVVPRLLVVATDRGEDPGAAERAGGALVLPLPTLTADEVVPLLEQALRVETTSGVDLAALARSLVAHTAGNALFLTEVLRELSVTGVDGIGADLTDLAVPRTVALALADRLAGLSATTVEVLQLAALLGLHVDTSILIDAAGDVSAADVLDALDQAVGAAVLVPVDGGGEHRFAHALFRSAVLDAMQAGQRARGHLQLAEALDRRRDQRPGALVEAAHHAVAAVPLGDPDAAARRCVEALDSLLRRLGFAEAEVLATDVLRMLQGLGRGERLVLAELRARLATALYGLGDVARSHEVARELAEDARSLGSGLLLAQAALLHGQYGTVGVADPVTIELCVDALGLLDPADVASRSEVLSMLAYYLTTAEGRADEGCERATEAVALARTAGNDRVLGRALWSLALARTGHRSAHDRLALLDEALAVIGERPWGTLLGDALQLRSQVRLELGDLDGAENDVRILEHIPTDHPWKRDTVVAFWRGVRAIMDGDLDLAEGLADQALLVGGSDPNVGSSYAGLLLTLRLEQGRLEELLPLVDVAIEMNPTLGAFRAARVRINAWFGRPEAAAAELGELVVPGLPAIQRDQLFAMTAAILAESAARLEDLDAAAVLYSALLPFSGTLITAGFGVVATSGPADVSLGSLALVLGDHEAAERHLAAGAELARSLASPVGEGRARFWQARLALTRGEDLDTAALEAERSRAADRGMVEVAQAFADVLAEV